jgi:hypothetical protein
MAINDDIKAAIDKNLSAEVGEILKRRLELAEADARKIVELKKLNEDLKSLVVSLEAQVAKAGDLDKKFQQLVATNAEVEKKLIRAEIYDLKVEHAKERVFDMKSLVSLVFQNNQFKYSTVENGSLPAGCDQYGNPRTTGYNRTSTGQGEGAPPPPPVGSP